MKKLHFPLILALILIPSVFALPLTALIFQESAKLAKEVAAWGEQCGDKPYYDESCLKKRRALSGELGQFVSLVNDELTTLRDISPNASAEFVKESNGRRKIMELEVRNALHIIKCLGMASEPQCSAESAAIDEEKAALQAEYKQTHAVFDGNWISLRATVSPAPVGSQPPEETTLTTASSPMAVELLTLKDEHSDNVKSVAFSPDSRRIVTGGDDATAKVWDAQSGKELLTLKGHSDTVDSVAFSPDGRRIATCSLDATKVWDAQSGKELLTLSVGAQVDSVAFSPDSRRIATCGIEAIANKVWDGQSGKELLTLEGLMGYSVAFSPDGKRVVIAGVGNTVKVWEFEKTVPESPNKGIQTFIPLPKGNEKASAPLAPARLRECRIISLKPGELLTVRKGPGANFPVVARYSFHQNELIRAGEGPGQRSSNAGTTWHALYSVSGPFIGWVEEGYLSKEGD